MKEIFPYDGIIIIDKIEEVFTSEYVGIDDHHPRLGKTNEAKIKIYYPGYKITYFFKNGMYYGEDNSPSLQGKPCSYWEVHTQSLDEESIKEAIRKQHSNPSGDKISDLLLQEFNPWK